MHRTLVPLVPSLLLAACTPNNAELKSTSYAAFISSGNSLSLQKETIDPGDWSKTWNVDCRDFEDPADKEALQLDEPLKICGDEIWPPEYEEWAIQSGFHVVVEDDIEPWRGEAVITSEGDLQLAFHHRLPGGADMRFVFSIDPDFAPVSCSVDEQEGTVVRGPMDGDWIENWSTELDYIAEQSAADETGAFGRPYAHLEPYLDGGRLYLLNSRSYQLNPADPTGADWDIPSQWSAGAAQGKFSEENLFHRTARFGEPQVYNAVEVADNTEYQYFDISKDELWYCDDITGDPREDLCMQAMEEEIREVQVGVREELDRMLDPDKSGEPVFSFAPITHINYWRESDGLPPGFDGWAEAHWNYVVFSGDSDLQVGGRAEGAFSFTFDADESSTRVFMTGQFVVEKIKKDRWTTSNLEQEKLIEKDVELCSAASEQDANPSDEK
jgi:hypothetical protein